MQYLYLTLFAFVILVSGCNHSDRVVDLINGKFVAHDKFDRETFVVYNNKIVGVAIPNLDYIKLSTFLYE